MNPAPISIAVPTRNRAVGLRDCLLSYHAHFGSSPPSVSYTVLDNSTRSSSFLENEALIEELHTHHRLDIHYINEGQRRLLCTQISAASQTPESMVHFALFGDARCPDSYGACRNALLLHAAGTVSLQVDDDTRCPIAPSPSTLPGLTLSSRHTPERYMPIASQPAPPEPHEGPGIFDIHTPALGKAPMDVIGDCMKQDLPPSITDASQELLSLLSLPDAIIATTYFGTAGDSGMQGHAYRLFEPGPCREKLVASEKDFERFMSTRWLIKSVPQTTISNSPHCMTIHIGLDARTLLPPFMPVMRNEDGVFGAVKHVCFPHYLSAYLPYTIQHLPPENRPAASLDDALRSPSMRTNDLLCQLILYAKPELGFAPSLQTLGGVS